MTESLLFEKISEKVKSFLIENGGMRNGYETTISGIIKKGCSYNNIEWYTPTVDNLTGKEKKKKSAKLYLDLKEIFGEEKYIDCIELKSDHIGDGCFEITIIFSSKNKINLW